MRGPRMLVKAFGSRSTERMSGAVAVALQSRVHLHSTVKQRPVEVIQTLEKQDFDWAAAFSRRSGSTP